jgi:dynein light chain LC8-type
VKDNCEKQFGPTWHCVVGRSFGSRVSYELETFALLKVNQHTVLIFKCG